MNVCSSSGFCFSLASNIVNAGTVRRNDMPYQYKREPFNNDELNKLTNACNTFREKFVIWIFLDTGW
jgi:hypothetical protein